MPLICSQRLLHGQSRRRRKRRRKSRKISKQRNVEGHVMMMMMMMISQTTFDWWKNWKLERWIYCYVSINVKIKLTLTDKSFKLALSIYLIKLLLSMCLESPCLVTGWDCLHLSSWVLNPPLVCYKSNTLSLNPTDAVIHTRPSSSHRISGSTELFATVNSAEFVKFHQMQKTIHVHDNCRLLC